MRARITGVWLALAGCAGSQGPAAEGPTGGAPAAMPGPARGRKADAVRENAACVGCHAAAATEWRASLHARANVEPTYRRAFAIEPLPFCRGCHAPEADPFEPESADVSALGVACVTCHVTDGGVLAAPRTDGHDDARAPHAITRDARFASRAACASCHEFAFPTALARPTRSAGDMMQTTAIEHAASPAASTSCAECHMPRDGGRARSHAFVASRDAATVKRAVAVRATRTGPSTARIELTPRAPGHAFPTGDLFRRVEVLAEATGPDTMVLGREARYLTRHFEPRRSGQGQRLLRDDRVMFETVHVDLDVGVAAPISWRVAYQRVEHPSGADDGDAALDGEIVLGEGVLPID